MKILFCIVLLNCSTLLSQIEWSLQQCIDTAMTKNSAILIARLNQTKTKVALQTNTFSFLPSLNGGLTHGYNFGQTIDPFTNQFATNRVQTDNLYLSSNATLFSGLQNFYNRKIVSLDYASQEINLMIEQRNQSIEVATYFLQCQLNKELMDLANSILIASKDELKRIDFLIQEGRKINLDKDKINSQIARDEISFQKAKNEWELSKINLQQLIGLAMNSNFRLKEELPFQNKSIDVENLEANLNRFQLEKQNLLIKQYHGQLSPRISINGSLGSGYSENNKFSNTNGEIVPKPFQTQLSENLYQSLSASLTIPLYNNHKNVSQIKIAELNLKQKKIEATKLEQSYSNKKKIMELEAIQAKGELKAYGEALNYSKIEFKNAELMYQEGRIGLYDYQYARNLFLKAQSDELQAKYKSSLAEFILIMF